MRIHINIIKRELRKQYGNNALTSAVCQIVVQGQCVNRKCK